MGVQLFANNAASTLASGITSGALSCSLAAGQGALFPNPTGGDYFLLTFTQAGSTETSWEIVKVTARSGDNLTIVRAQEGTTAAAWATSDKAELRLTAGALGPLEGVADDTTTNATFYPVIVSANTGNLPLFVSSSKLSVNPGTGEFSVVKIIATNGTTTTTFGLNSNTITGTLNGVIDVELKNLSNGASAFAGWRCFNDQTLQVQIGASGSGRTATRFGIASANYGEFLTLGASAAGMFVGVSGQDKPVIFGIGSTVVARLTGETLTTQSFHVYYTGDATSSTAGAGVILDSGLSVAKTMWAATVKTDNAIAILYGGTGATTKAAAFDALSPMAHAGALIIGGTAGTGTELIAGTNGYVLTMVSGAPAWAPTAGTAPDPVPLVEHNSSDPSTPSAGTASLYAQQVGSFDFARVLGSNGMAFNLAISLFESTFYSVHNSGGTGVTTIGITDAPSGTQTFAIPATGSYFSMWQRQKYRSATTGSAGCGHIFAFGAQIGPWIRGNTAGQGGFLWSTEFAQADNVNASSAFCGLWNSVAFVGAADADSKTNIIGMCYRVADSSAGNWQFVRNDAGTATIFDLGSSAPRDTTTVFRMEIGCAPNDSNLWVRITNLTTGAIVLDASYSTSIPVNTTALAAQLGANNRATGANVSIVTGNRLMTGFTCQ